MQSNRVGGAQQSAALRANDSKVAHSSRKAVARRTSPKAEGVSIDKSSVRLLHFDTCRWDRDDPTVGSGSASARSHEPPFGEHAIVLFEWLQGTESPPTSYAPDSTIAGFRIPMSERSGARALTSR